MSKILLIECDAKGSVAYVKIRGPLSDFATANAVAFESEIDALIAAGAQMVEVSINSPGGDPLVANQMQNVLNRFPGKKTCIIEALAASAATMFLHEFDVVECYQNSQAMIHEPKANLLGATVGKLESNVKLLKNLRAGMVEGYAKMMGKEAAEVEEMIKEDYWMNAQEMKSLGIVSKIRKGKAEMLPSDAEAVLKMYASAPEPIRIAAMATQHDTNLDMEKIKLLAPQLGLSASATEDEVIVAVQAAVTETNALKAKVKELQDKLQAEADAKAAADLKAANDAIEAALKDNKIDAAQKTVFAEQAKTNPEFVVKMLGAMKPHSPLSAHLNTGNAGKLKGREDWGWDKWFKEAGTDLEALKKENPEYFKELFRTKFNKEYAG